MANTGLLMTKNSYNKHLIENLNNLGGQIKYFLYILTT